MIVGYSTACPDVLRALLATPERLKGVRLAYSFPTRRQKRTWRRRVSRARHSKHASRFVQTALPPHEGYRAIKDIREARTIVAPWERG